MTLTKEEKEEINLMNKLIWKFEKKLYKDKVSIHSQLKICWKLTILKNLKNKILLNKY